MLSSHSVDLSCLLFYEESCSLFVDRAQPLTLVRSPASCVGCETNERIFLYTYWGLLVATVREHPMHMDGCALHLSACIDMSLYLARRISKPNANLNNMAFYVRDFRQNKRANGSAQSIYANAPHTGGCDEYRKFFLLPSPVITTSGICKYFTQARSCCIALTLTLQWVLVCKEINKSVTTTRQKSFLGC
jgi:hypothetical protein